VSLRVREPGVFSCWSIGPGRTAVISACLWRCADRAALASATRSSATHRMPLRLSHARGANAGSISPHCVRCVRSTVPEQHRRARTPCRNNLHARTWRSAAHWRHRSGRARLFVRCGGIRGARDPEQPFGSRTAPCRRRVGVPRIANRGRSLPFSLKSWRAGSVSDRSLEKLQSLTLRLANSGRSRSRLAMAIRVLDGPQHEWFTDDSFFAQKYV